MAKSPEQPLQVGRLTHNCGAYAEFYIPGQSPQALTTYEDVFPRLQRRGEDGRNTLAIHANGDINVWSTDIPLPQAFDTIDYAYFRDESSRGDMRALMGHHRYRTSGDPSALQPFVSTRKDAERDGLHPMATEHNGNGVNARALLEFIPQGLRERMTSDTHIIHTYMRAFPGKTVAEKIANGALEGIERALQGDSPYAPEEGVQLSYSLIMADLADPDRPEIVAVRDPWGNRPLAVGEMKNGAGWLVGSESLALRAKATNVRSIRPGEAIKINDDGVESFHQDKRQVEGAHCSMEWIYLSEADSPIQKFRYECGTALADIDYEKGFIPDAILPVLGSGEYAGKGYYDRMKQRLLDDGRVGEHDRLEYLKEALKPRKKGRTFIASGDRGLMVDNKFEDDLSSWVAGKVIVNVDDSMVRGTTSERKNLKLRRSGALEIHDRFASPKYRESCFMGIDTPDRRELMANDEKLNERSDEDIARLVGANSVGFLPVSLMVEIADKHFEEKPCTACFTGDYPVAPDTMQIFAKTSEREIAAVAD